MSSKSRRIKVTFPPKPQPPIKVKIYPQDSFAKLEAVFSANPVPNDDQAVWHVANSFDDESDDLVVVKSGHTADGKYEALSLNVSKGHKVSAVFYINDLHSYDQDRVYYLQVFNGKIRLKYFMHDTSKKLFYCVMFYTYYILVSIYSRSGRRILPIYLRIHGCFG